MKILIGNIFDSDAKTLVNTVNCVGVMGKGVALEFKRRYPDMFKEYEILCKEGKVRPGHPYYYQDLCGTSIINFPTKDHWRSSSKLSYISNGLKWFEDNYEKLGITSVAFPPLGCGNGGLTWGMVGPLMYNHLKGLPIDVEIYAPYGTSAYQLTEGFLEANMIHNAREVLGAKSTPFKREWLLILETIKKINAHKYALATGRTIIQKIAYVLTLLGVDTGFHFEKGNYGPYCKDVTTAMTSFSNANLITEQQVGKMFKIDVTDYYLSQNNDFSEFEMNAVDKTVNLFARIKMTEDAELFATVIYAFQQLQEKQENVTEKDIYDYVVRWKKRWQSDEKKSEKLIDTIRNLAMLQWIKPSFTQGLLKEFDTD